jgi:hypothetical protein
MNFSRSPFRQPGPFLNYNFSFLNYNFSAIRLGFLVMHALVFGTTEPS